MKKTNLFLLLILSLYQFSIKPSFTKQGTFIENYYIATTRENNKNYLEIHDGDKYYENDKSLILKKEIVGPKGAVALRPIDENRLLYVDEEGSDYLVSFIEEKSNNLLHDVMINKLTKKDKEIYNLTKACSLIEKNFSIKALKDGHVRLYNPNNILMHETLITPNSCILNLKIGTTNDNQSTVFYSTPETCVGGINISNNNNDFCIDSSNDILDSQDKVYYAKFDNNKETPNLLTLSSTPNENQLLVRVINLMSKNSTQGVINKNINLEEYLKKEFVITQSNEEEINLTYDDKTTAKITFSEYINNSPTTLFVDNLIIRVSNKNEIDLYKNKKYKDTWQTGLNVPIVNLLLCKKFDHEGNEKKDTIAFEALDGSVGKIIIADSKTKPYFTRLVYPIK